MQDSVVYVDDFFITVTDNTVANCFVVFMLLQEVEMKYNELQQIHNNRSTDSGDNNGGFQLSLRTCDCFYSTCHQTPCLLCFRGTAVIGDLI